MPNVGLGVHELRVGYCTKTVRVFYYVNRAFRKSNTSYYQKAENPKKGAKQNDSFGGHHLGSSLGK